MGVMTSFGSYNPVKKPIIEDTFIISISNSLISFISGFAVWGIVGFMNKEYPGRTNASSGFSLVFETYPEAIDTFEGGTSTFFGILLSLTLFLLGLDSAMAFVEAISTVIYDGLTAPPHRAVITLFLCIGGWAISLLFCTNWGLILFDVWDHYLGVYLLFLVGILQCFGCGWCFDLEKTAAKSDAHWKSVQISTYGYWFFLFLCGVAGIADYNAQYGMLAFITVECAIVLPYSFIACDTTYDDWYDNVCMVGVKRIGYSISKLARLEQEDPTQMLWWEPFFVFYFGFCTKYLIPFGLWFLLLFSIQDDVDDPYGGYSWRWQLAGLVVPIIGVIVFVFFTCFCLVDADLPEDELAVDLTAQEISDYKNELKNNEIVDGDKMPLNANGTTDSKVAPEPNQVEMGEI
jgi:hypothetical protein